MTVQTIEEIQVKEFAEQCYEMQKTEFVNDLVTKINSSIKTGMAQFEAGESMDFEEFKNKFINEHSLNGKI